MIFRRTIMAAFFVGIIASILLSVAQITGVNPIIFEAETYEVETKHQGSLNHHSDESWAPEDGLQRTMYTLLANASAGIGFAAILLSMMSQLQLQGTTQVNLKKGLAWGAAGFTVFFVAPGIGLPPEIPGIEAAPVEHRQLWWLFAVSGVGLGLLILSFAPIKFKLSGFAFIILPYLIGAPHSGGPTFVTTDAQAVTALTHLHQQFILASSLSNLLFWITLGVTSAWVLNSWVLKGVQYTGGDGEPVNI
ncbi:MAG: CbtA family protein [Pseudomonadales bacterium]|nr:CbtA family protein [Pseudomonadales bacterium]